MGQDGNRKRAVAENTLAEAKGNFAEAKNVLKQRVQDLKRQPPHDKSGAGVILIREGESGLTVLLTQQYRHGRTQWELPKGGAENKETLEAAA